MKVNRNILKFILFLFMIILISVNLEAVSLTNWQNFSKKIIGLPSPLLNVPPYTVMTNQGNGLWQFSAYFIPGQTLTLKFSVSTNGSDYISELSQPKEFEVTFGTQGNVYYLSNTPIGLIRVTEGSNTNNAYMQIEFNWEDEPDAPTGLYVKNVQPNSAELFWSKSSELDVIGYNVYISNNYFPYYYKANTDLITTNYFKFTNLVTGSSNSVYVTAVDAYTNMPNNESERSSIINFIADRYVTVMFYLKKRREDVNDAVYICGDTPPLDWNFSQKMEYLYNDLWYYHSRFINGTKITYKYNIDKDSSKWEDNFDTDSGNREVVINDIDRDNKVIINDSWSIGTIDNPAPSAPTNIVAVPLNSGVQLYWDKNTEVDFKNYRIYRSKNNTNNFSLITNIEKTNFIDDEVENNTNYYYRITALDIGGYESEYSENILVTPMTNAPPICPRGIKAFAYNKKVFLSWGSNPETDISGYVVYRAVENKYTVYSNISGLVINTVYTDTSVSNNTTYFYKLKAVDTISQTNDGFSEIVEAIPSSNVKPAAPENLHLISVKSGKLFIKWSPNNETNVNHYNVYYKKESGIESSPLNTLNYSNFEITGLDNGYKYTVYITAVNNKGLESEQSESITAYPVPDITDLTVKPAGTVSGGIKLKWTSPDKAGPLGNPTRFIIKYSTEPITTFKEFQNSVTYQDIIADVAGTSKTVIVKNLGTDSPGFYFTVAAVYGNEVGISLSDSLYNVASMIVSPLLGGTFRKINSTLKVVIPNSVLPNNASAIVIKNYQDLKKENSIKVDNISDANKNVENFSSYKLINGNTNVFSIYAVDYNGDEIETKNRMTGNVYIYFPVNDINHNLIVDETESGDNINVNTLKLFFVNDNLKQWAVIQNSYFDSINNYVVGKVSHFSEWSVFSKSPQSDLSEVSVYPNPIYKPSDANPLIFTKLTAGAKIKIFTITGEIVKDGLVSDSVGECSWNCKNNDGIDVASGIYLYYIEDGVSEPAKGKFAIIR